MAHYVIRIARNAGIIALFVVAGMLGILSGVLFAYAGDLPQISALDDYTPSTITRVYAANGQVIGEFATQRRVIVGYDDINPLLRQAIIATEDTEFDRHFGVNVWRIAVAGAIDIIERRRAQGASTLTQQLARNLKDQFGLTSKSQETFAESLERKIKEIDPRDPDREALHQAGDLHDLLQPDVPRARRLRRRGGVAAVLQQVEQGSHPRGSGADRRHVPAPRAAEPVRRHEARGRRGATSCCSGWPTRATSRRREADDAKQKPIVTRGQPTQPPGIAPFFVEEVRKHLEQQYGAKALYESGLRGHDDARRDAAGDGQPRRSSTACGRSTSGMATASRSATSSPSGTPIDGYRDDRWTRPIAAGDVVPAVVVTARQDRRRRALRIGRYHADLDARRDSRGPAAHRPRICSSRAI